MTEQRGKWTPGPWEVYENETGIGVTPSANGQDIGEAWGKATDHHKVATRPVDEQRANAELWAEAGTVAHETGMTPSQLQARVVELEGALRGIDNIVNALACLVPKPKEARLADFEEALPNTADAECVYDAYCMARDLRAALHPEPRT